jgi:hypothetical protein
MFKENAEGSREQKFEKTKKNFSFHWYMIDE